MTVPQHEFDVVLPTTDQAVPPNALVPGQLTAVNFDITVGTTKTTYSVALDPALVPGVTVKVPFTALPFTPVAGTKYTADAFVVDAAGNGALSTTVTWTQAAPATPPAAPTFTVV